MSRHVLLLGLLGVIVAGLAGPGRGQEKPAATPCACDEGRKWTFDSNDALAGWTITGDVTIDMTKGRQEKGGALKVGPGGKALLKLRDKDESGKVELWVYDDGTQPQDVKAHRVGPRWGLVQSDGKVLAAGILYANYLGGNEGYTATACDAKDWFDQLFWLGVNRAPAIHGSAVIFAAENMVQEAMKDYYQKNPTGRSMFILNLSDGKERVMIEPGHFGFAGDVNPPPIVLADGSVLDWYYSKHQTSYTFWGSPVAIGIIDFQRGRHQWLASRHPSISRADDFYQATAGDRHLFGLQAGCIMGAVPLDAQDKSPAWSSARDRWPGVSPPPARRRR